MPTIPLLVRTAALQGLTVRARACMHVLPVRGRACVYVLPVRGRACAGSACEYVRMPEKGWVVCVCCKHNNSTKEEDNSNAVHA